MKSLNSLPKGVHAVASERIRPRPGRLHRKSCGDGVRLAALDEAIGDLAGKAVELDARAIGEIRRRADAMAARNFEAFFLGRIA
jgi:hypothetical protein